MLAAVGLAGRGARLPAPAVRRRTAAGRDRPRAGAPAAADAGRRADRQPRPGHRAWRAAAAARRDQGQRRRRHLVTHSQPRPRSADRVLVLTPGRPASRPCTPSRAACVRADALAAGRRMARPPGAQRVLAIVAIARRRRARLCHPPDQRAPPSTNSRRPSRACPARPTCRCAAREAWFDEALYPRLAQHAASRVASPVLEVDAARARRSTAAEDPRHRRLPRRRRSRPTCWACRTRRPRFDIAGRRRHLPVAGRDGMAEAAAPATTLRAARRHRRRRAARGRRPAAGARRASASRVMDIGAAQWRFDRARPAVAHRPEAARRRRPRRFERALARNWSATSPAASGRPAERQRPGKPHQQHVSRAYRVNLTVLALVALFTGAFLVFSTQALSVIRRRSQFALLRVLGLNARQLLRQVLLEGAHARRRSARCSASRRLRAGRGRAALVRRRPRRRLFPRRAAAACNSRPAPRWCSSLLGLGVALLGCAGAGAGKRRAPRPAQALKSGQRRSGAGAPGAHLARARLPGCWRAPADALPPLFELAAVRLPGGRRCC